MKTNTFILSPYSVWVFISWPNLVDTYGLLLLVGTPNSVFENTLETPTCFIYVVISHSLLVPVRLFVCVCECDCACIHMHEFVFACF